MVRTEHPARAGRLAGLSAPPLLVPLAAHRRPGHLLGRCLERVRLPAPARPSDPVAAGAPPRVHERRLARRLPLPPRRRAVGRRGAAREARLRGSDPPAAPVSRDPVAATRGRAVRALLTAAGVAVAEIA